jgi:hypothetical protein
MTDTSLPGRSRRRSQRQPMGLSRDLRRHHRHKPPNHPSSAQKASRIDWPRRHPQQQIAIPINKLPAPKQRGHREPEEQEQRITRAPAFNPQRDCVGKRRAHTACEQPGERDVEGWRRRDCYCAGSECEFGGGGREDREPEIWADERG